MVCWAPITPAVSPFDQYIGVPEIYLYRIRMCGQTRFKFNGFEHVILNILDIEDDLKHV